MASDSQATETDLTHHSEEKIWTSHGLLFGYTGNTAVGEPIQDALEKELEGFDPSQDRAHVEGRLCEIVRGVLQPAYENFLPMPGDNPARAVMKELGGTLLVIGHDSEYWLLDINAVCTPTRHMTRRFHTVGSGSQAAQIVNNLLEHHDTATLGIWKLKLMAYRSVSACTTSLHMLGVGGDVQLWGSSEEGFVRATNEELDGLKRNVEEWLRTEAEGFDQLGSEGADPLPDEFS